MHYHVYSGPKGSPDVSQLEKSQLLSNLCSATTRCRGRAI
jgi:hypothetical protein